MDQLYWQNRYQKQHTEWNIGQISTPIKEYIDQLKNKELKILVPGAGFGHEVGYLFQEGFQNVYLLDFVDAALEDFKINNPDFPEEQLLQQDFFKHQGQYDVIIEQTLFCAISPEYRDEYVKQVYNLLRPGGKLIGLFFDCVFESGPPFGGSRSEYQERFSKYFPSVSFETCYNSIAPRKDREVFGMIQK